MKRRLSSRRVALVAVAIGIAAPLSYCGQPLIHDNDQAINVIVTVFSVLAGFLIAIIAVVGDPVTLPPGTWRAAEMERQKLDDRLTRHKWLFICYLLTLGFIFSALLIARYDLVFAVWLERGFLFLGSFSFLLSLGLPSALMRAQKERIDAVIEHRRSLDKIVRDVEPKDS